MFANGPQWTNAGPPSRVWSRFGLIASTQQGRHRAGDLEVLGGDRLPGGRLGEDDPAEPRPQVGQVAGEGEDGHDLAGHGDDGLGLARHAVLAAAEADHHLPERPIADVDDPRPGDRERVDPERVLVMEAVVDEGGREVVGRADGVDVAGQMEVEVLHRDDLAVAAARGAALDPEDRSERRLADRDGGSLADPVQALGEPDRGRRLALAERGRGDRGDEDVLAARVRGLEPFDRLEADLGLDRTVELDLVLGQAEVGGHVDDPAWRDRTGDLEVGREAHADRLLVWAGVRLPDGGTDEVGEQQGVGHRTDPAGNRADRPGDELGRCEIDVADDRISDDVDPDIDDDGARVEHVARDQPGSAGRDDQDVGATRREPRGRGSASGRRSPWHAP